MARSLSIRRRGMVKASPSPPAGRRSDELSLLAIPYSSTKTSEPPIQMAPVVKSPMSPSTLCSNPPSPTKPISTTSSIYPDSTHSTVVPDSPHSSILSPFPARDDLNDPSVMPGGGEKPSSGYAVTQVWEDIYDASTTTYVAEPENELPAYLGPHIIETERDEDQPAELFAVPSTPPSFSARPSAQQSAAGARTHNTHPATWSSPEHSRCPESQSMLRTLKKKSRFWGTLRLGRRTSIAPPENEPLEPPYEHTRNVRLGSNTDTVTTEESVVTPLDEVCPWETSHGPPGGGEFVKEKSQLGDGRDILDDAVDGDGVPEELCHTLAVDIPRDSHFGDEFWAKFPQYGS
ncbi:hypothetical protein E4U55_006295 [Claviceps digitariae]|nr:hypothetical protein E4U55_006295 [Claviceps digitariae]